MNYVNSKTLDVPVVTASGTVISWPKVTDAEFYTLTVNGQKVDGGALVEIKNHTIVVRGESYDTSVLGAGSFTVTVKAENNDRVVYKPSANSAEVTVKSVSKLKTPASVNVNSDGNIEYSLVTSAEKYKIEIYDPDSIKLFECFNLNVSGANGLYDFADFLAENEMSAGIYRIDISAYASDEVAEFIVSSDVRNFNLRVTALSSATVTVGTRIGAYGDTDFGREVKWSSVRNALGYNVYVDGQKVNTDVVTGTSFTLSESANLAAGSTHEISVVALGNGKTLWTAKLRPSASLCRRFSLSTKTATFPWLRLTSGSRAVCSDGIAWTKTALLLPIHTPLTSSISSKVAVCKKRPLKFSPTATPNS